MYDRLSPAMPPLDLTVFDDDELVARVRSGDRGAFGALVERHQRAALRVAAVISGSTEEANDIVQDAMVKAFHGLDGYRGTSTVRSWMLRVVANEAKNHVRGRVRRLRRDDRVAGRELRVATGADATALDRLEHEELARALGRLGANDRAVLGCRFVADLSEAETATVLGIARGTVKSRTSRALDRLRAELDGELGGTT
jgi:RNA polymerase sigma-70 factor, ECF subfamily